MQQVLDFFRKLFDTSDFPARWHCGRWTDFHGWLYISSDLLIWSAYFAIPLLLFSYMRKKEVPFHRVFYLFGAFILACSVTHLLDAVIFWSPVYRLSALARFVTGVISWITVFALLRVLPAAFAMRTPVDFEKEIEKRKAVEQELNKNNHLLNLAQQIARMGHWEWRRDEGAIVRGSAELLRIYEIGGDSGVLHYADLLQRTHPDDRDYMVSNWQKAMQEGFLAPSHYRLVGSSNQIVHIMVRGDALRNENGELIGLIGTAQDVTQAKKTEEELLQKTRDLESKVVELQRFAFIASHDLKEPLRKIGLFASRLQSQFGAALPEKGVEYVQKIQENAHRQQQLVDEIMQFSRLSESQEAKVWTSLSALAEEVCNDLELLIQDNQAIVQIGALPEAPVAPVQIRILFQNLLNNALKFRLPDRVPEIHISGEIVTRSHVDWPQEIPANFSIINDPTFREQFCKVVVQDNGIGFAPEYAQTIFQMFKRLHGHEYAGTGLGLAICKQIVDNHGGIINATGHPGEGAVFTIFLPLSSTTLPTTASTG